MPSNIPEGLNFYDNATVETSPRKLNADSEGNPLTFKIEMGDGFRILSVNLSKLWLNESINPVDYHIVDLLTWTLTFDRAEVNDLINALGLEPPYTVYLEVTGLVNDDLLFMTFGDEVLVHQDEDETLVLVVGLTGSLALPVVGVKQESKIRKLLNRLRKKFSEEE